MSTPSPVFWHNASVGYRATLIPGDGIGPEVAEATVRALAATGVEIEWERVELTGELIVASHGELPGWVIESLERTGLGLKGPVTTPVASGYQSVNVILRKRLDLFASERIARYAFHFARAAGRKKIMAVHKVNIMKLSDGMFLRRSREVARSSSTCC